MALGLMALPFLTLPSLSQEAEIAEIRKTWATCEAMIREAPDQWIGWRRDFFNGYGDAFRFWENRLTDNLPSVLVVERTIDATAFVTDISCYRRNESLAFIFSVMQSHNTQDPDTYIQREGRIYFDQSGKVIRVFGWIADAEGKKLGGLTDSRFQLTRDCTSVAVHPKIDDAITHYFSVLGDIDGTKPTFTEQQFDWCSVAKPE
jgi:hypothetical protein